MVAAVIDRHVAQWPFRPFRHGSDDCAFAIRAILEETGATSIYQNRVGEFRTPAEIEEFMADETGGQGLATLIRRIAAAHLWPRIRPLEARDGDLALYRHPLTREPVVAIVRAPMALTRTPAGMLAVPLHEVSVAFRVKHGH